MIAIAIVVLILFLYFYIKYFRPLRPKEAGFEYVYVEDTGIVRELDNEEIEYLKTDFSPADGARPYIKSYYSQLTPDKKIGGFIQRIRVPKKIIIKKSKTH